jgi:hypothetical protein
VGSNSRRVPAWPLAAAKQRLGSASHDLRSGDVLLTVESRGRLQGTLAGVGLLGQEPVPASCWRLASLNQHMAAEGVADGLG